VNDTMVWPSERDVAFVRRIKHEQYGTLHVCVFACLSALANIISFLVLQVFTSEGLA
jgi:hypothetical protein